MKKIISVFLTLVLCVGLFAALGASAYAANEMTDIFEFEEVKNKTSKNGNFELSTTYVSDNGWAGGGGRDNDTLTIYAPNNDLMITRIEAVIGNYGWSYGKVGVSGTAHKEQNDRVENGKTVTVTNINASEFSFAGGSDWVAFKNITVYYTDDVPTATPEPTATPTPAPTAPPTPAPTATPAPTPEGQRSEKIYFNKDLTATSENGNFELSTSYYTSLGWWGGKNDTLTIRAKGGQTISRIDALITQDGLSYGNVGVSVSTAEKGSVYTKDGVNMCSVTNINASEFSFIGGDAGVGFGDITVYYTVDSTASTLSEGNIWIICAIGAAAVIALGAIVIGKKKNAVADGKED